MKKLSFWEQMAKEQQIESTAEISGCEIYGNKKNGIYIANFAKPKITDCKIHDNKTEGKGYLGIIVAGYSEPEISGCEIYNHLSCGIWIVQNAKGTCKNCKIHDNGDKAIEVDKKGLKNVFSGVKISSCEE